jgi:DNA-binding PucR family transcriptional regulator
MPMPPQPPVPDANGARADGAALNALLAGLGPAETMLAFLESRLGGLRDYDRQHNADLVRTLEAYYASGGSLAGTAERLQTHRNTVLYRLHRIQEVAGADLRDPHTALELQVALRIRATLEPRPGSDQ